MQISPKDLLSYSAITIALTAASLPIYIHSPDFYARNFSLSLSSIGLVLLFVRLIDAIQDPIIGILCDKLEQKRLTLIVASALTLSISIFILFNPLQSSIYFSFIASLILSTTAFSFLSINVNTIGGLWSEDYNEKTRITTYREALAMLGLLVGAASPSIFESIFPEYSKFTLFSYLHLTTTFICLFFFIRWYKKENFEHQKSSLSLSSYFTEGVKSLKSNFKFFTAYFLSSFSSSIPAVLILFYVRDIIGREELNGVFLIIYFLSGAIGMPLWQKASKHFGKENAWVIAMILACLSFIWAFLLGEGDVTKFAIICFTSGIAFGAELALPPSILSDVIDQTSSRESATTQFSILTFLYKAGLSISSAIVLISLESFGYFPGEENTETAKYALSAFYALIPCFIKALSILVLLIRKKS